MNRPFIYGMLSLRGTRLLFKNAEDVKHGSLIKVSSVLEFRIFMRLRAYLCMFTWLLSGFIPETTGATVAKSVGYNAPHEVIS